MAVMHGGLIRIGELSRRTGVSVEVIRAWERRYALLRPERTEANYRLYSADDVARLRLMQQFVGRGITPQRAAELVVQAQSAAVDRNPGVPEEDVRQALRVLRTLEAFDDGPATKLLGRMTAVFTPGAVLRDVVLAYLRDIGERWECGEATVAQEHFASAFLQGWMLSMSRGWGQKGELRAVLGGVPGERHELGLIAFGLMLHDLGWRITYLGADVPVGAVATTAEAVGADVVVLSAATDWIFAPVAAAVAGLARERTVAVGGAGTRGPAVARYGLQALPSDPLVAAEVLRDMLPGTPPAGDYFSAAGQAIR